MKIKRDKYDIICSKLKRKRDGCCAGCGRKPPWKLEVHHVMPRSRSSTRYLFDNLLTLCFLCHKKAHAIGKDYCIKLLGKKEYKRLEKLSLVYVSRKKAREIFLESTREKESD